MPPQKSTGQNASFITALRSLRLDIDLLALIYMAEVVVTGAKEQSLAFLNISCSRMVLAANTSLGHVAPAGMATLSRSLSNQVLLCLTAS